jgi:hypothetical protein
MPTPRHLFKPERHRALELLAPCGHGCTETTMLAHGFSIEMMVELINAGLATVQTERGGRARVRITEAGRRAPLRPTCGSLIGQWGPSAKAKDRFGHSVESCTAVSLNYRPIRDRLQSFAR